MKSSKTVNIASHGSNIARINRTLFIYTLLKQFKLSKLIEVEKYQHQETTLLQLGAHLWSCILEILVQLSSFSIYLIKYCFTWTRKWKTTK